MGENMNIFHILFDTMGFPPRWRCGSAWTPLLGWTHIISDLLITLSYFSIPVVLGYFIIRRKDIPFNGIFLLFGGFIFLCGFGHLVEAIIFWEPVYRFSGLVKALTAIFSIGTALVLVIYIPKILSLPKFAEIRSYLASIVESSKDAILSFDKEGVINTANKAAQKLLKGYYKRDYGKDIMTFLAAFLPDIKNLQELFSRLTHNEIQNPLEFQLEKKGKTYYFLGTLSPVWSVDNELIGASLIVKDNTKEKEVHTKLVRAYNELEAFSYMASHDLKEPLRGIQSYVSLLETEYGKSLPKDVKSKLASIGELSYHLYEVIETLLYVAQIGRKPLYLTSIKMDKLIADVKERLFVQLQKTKAEVKVVGKMPDVWGEEVLLSEVLQNLILNSLKYNDQKEKKVEIGVADYVIEKKTSSVLLYVKDNGVGIEPRHHETIFQIFKRLHGRDKYGEGHGAGLTIVKKIIELHGGRIWLKSTPGAGSTFFFLLPGRVA